MLLNLSLQSLSKRVLIFGFSLKYKSVSYLVSESSKSINTTSSVLILTNIYQLNAREKIQQATIGFIVHNIQHTEQLEKLKNIFEFLDINKDGELTYAEIRKAILKIFPDEYITEEKIQIIIDKMDENKDGVISYEEFLRVTMDEKILLEKNNLKLAFNKFDLNKDGKLSKEELLNVLDQGTSKYVDSLLELIDKNKDGYISFDEFCHLMSKVVER